MRHTFATYYYQLTKNLKKVSVKLGHTKTKNTDKYVAIAEDLEEQFKGKNLFNIALKPHNINVGGKQNNNRLLWVRGVKGVQLKVISPVGVDGLSRAKHFLQKGLLWVECHFHHQLKVQFFFNNHLITTKWPLKPFFFSLSFFVVLINSFRRCNYACAMV